MNLEVQDTISAVELNVGEACILNNELEVRVISQRATVDSSSVPYPSELVEAGENPHTVPAKPLVPRSDARMVLRMHVVLEIDSVRYELVRLVGSQRSFYEPWRISGYLVFFDAAVDLFLYLGESHGSCRPGKDVRLAFAKDRICPPLLQPWCPLPKGGLSIQESYTGSDCWMGPYMGYDAHGGLDINHPAGTPIWAPFSLDEQGLYNSLEHGDSNNRWHGTRLWANGTRFTIRVHHISQMLVPDAVPVEGGVQIARGAGVAVGAREHSHFTFAVTPANGREILLDPWILFWQMYEDRKLSRS